MKKILYSAASIVFIGVLAYSATGAFFSDTETSTGNTFAAGDIDLQIDNESYAIDFNIPGFQNPTGALVANPGNSWEMADLIAGTHKFFDFSDVKPGDYGEDTISIHVGSNDAWMCAAARLTEDNDFTYTEPEEDDDTTVGGDPLLTDGELDEVVQFAFWNDDGDNVYEPGGQGGETIFLSGPLSALDEAGQMSLASPAGGAFGTSPIPGGETIYIGKMWCAGDMVSTNLVQDGVNTGSPLTLGTGFTCDGSDVNNAAQTDVIEGDMQFYAVQSRNNADFTCEDYTPTWPTEEEPTPILVGAALGAYVAPDCTTTVTDGNSIQAAIDANGPGSTICVGPGTHDSDTYPLRVNEDNMSLVSTGGAAVTTLSGGVILDNDGTKVMGFTLSSSNALSEVFGVYINTGVDNAVVSFNDMNGPGVGSGRGVVNAIGTTNALIANNEISNYLTGVFLNPSTNMIVEKNDLVSNGVGSGNDNPTGNIVRNNQITGNTLEGVGVLSVGANSIAVNFNNIFGNGGAANELNAYDPADPINAENNWWGDLTPADEIGGVGAAFVDSNPFAGAVYAQN